MTGIRVVTHGDDALVVHYEDCDKTCSRPSITFQSIQEFGAADLGRPVVYCDCTPWFEEGVCIDCAIGNHGIQIKDGDRVKCACCNMTLFMP